MGAEEGRNKQSSRSSIVLGDRHIAMVRRIRYEPSWSLQAL